MQMLWAAEIQARQFGCTTGPDPFEQAQLPLLATMQFDGFMHKGGEWCSKKWFLKTMFPVMVAACRFEQVVELETVSFSAPAGNCCAFEGRRSSSW